MVDISETIELDWDQMSTNLETAMEEVNDKIDSLSGDSMDMGEMFSMQLTMNKFSQLAQVTTDVQAAVQTAAMAMARNVKG